MFSTVFLSLIISYFYFLLLIFPSFIFIVNQCFLLETVTLRKQRCCSALSYSKSIVKGRWWKVGFIFIVLIPHLLMMIYILKIMTDLIVLINPLLNYFMTIILNLYFILLVKFQQVFRTIYFLNLEFRKN